jgi:hypothetical protein
MYAVNGNGRQFGAGTGFVKWANELEILRFKSLYVYKNTL